MAKIQVAVTATFVILVIASAAGQPQAEPSPEPQQFFNSSLLHIYAADGNLPQLQSLIEEYNPSLTTCYESPNIDGMSDYYMTEAQSLLFAHGKEECMTVLSAAAIGRQAEVIEYLIKDMKADPNYMNNVNKTALHYAFNSFTVYWHPCTADFVETVTTLLNLGADPTLPMSYGQEPFYTVLHFEAFDGNRHGLLPALIAAGADVNAKDSRGFSPLHSAARCDFRLSCDDCGCSREFCYPAQPSATVTTDDCPPIDEGTDPYDEILSNPRALQFFGAKPTLQYLVAMGGDPFAVTNAGETLVDLVPHPSDPTNETDWMTGTCRETYKFITSLGVEAGDSTAREGGGLAPGEEGTVG